MKIEEFPLNDPNFDPTSVPWVAKLASGEVPGVLVTEQDLPAFKPLDGNGRSLFTKAGLVMAPTSAGAALFNPDVLKLAEIEKLDEAGSLTEVLPSLSTLAAEDDGAAGAEPAPREPIPLPSPQPLAAAVPTPAPSVQRGIARGRLNNLATPGKPPTQTGSPTSGLLARLRAPVT